MDTGTLDAVHKQIRGAKVYADVFGALTGDTISRRGQLRKSFAFLARTVHPDHVHASLRTKADEVFRALNKLRLAADEAIQAKQYDVPLAAMPSDIGTEHVTITSKKGEYSIQQNPFATGDFSQLYRGKSSSGPIIAKISSEPSCNTWLEKDAAVLATLQNGEPHMQALQAYMPVLLDTFIMPHDRKHFRVNVVKAVPDLVSVADIITAFPNGLEAPQVAWVARRIIAQAIAAQMLNRVHAGITPDHVLVDPYKHEPLHIGWAHALKDPETSHERITHVVDRWRDIYPPEVFDKKIPDHRTDLYMAGATIVKLLGGDVVKRTLPATVPETMAKVVLRAIETSPARRPEDAVQYLDEFTRVVRGIWGRVYRPLFMPVH